MLFISPFQEFSYDDSTFFTVHSAWCTLLLLSKISTTTASVPVYERAVPKARYISPLQEFSYDDSTFFTVHSAWCTQLLLSKISTTTASVPVYERAVLKARYISPFREVTTSLSFTVHKA